MRNAPANEAGALAKVSLGHSSTTGTPRHTLSRNASQASERLLVARYRAARGRLNAGLALVETALDLHEQLHWGCFDLDDARAEVRAFRRKCRCWQDRRAA
jgi:hypothetical protein